MTTIIRCENVTLGYGTDIVLSDISLEIPRGVFLPFVGPNGSGKTTLLRGILGLLKPFSGRIFTPFKDSPAGYMPQHRSIDPLFPLTVRQILQMGLYPKLGFWKNPDKKDSDQINAVLEELSLAHAAHKNFRDLSGGMKQKTLIGRALISKAEVFVMDEPTSELDEASENEVLRHLVRFVKEEEKTVLLVHHSPHPVILESAAEVCVVNHGKIQRMPVARWQIRGRNTC